MTSINSLHSDHKNARKRTDQSAELIKESLSRYGAARSIVIDEDNRILAGNGTIEGAKAAGIKNVRIIETDGTEVIAVKRTGLTEDEKIGLALADNRTSDLSDWDQEMLRRLSEEHDLAPWFNQDDLDELLATTELEPEQGNTDPDDVPEAPEDPITKPGDLWILGNHRLLCGDSTNPQHVERLMDGKKADMVFTDPPYGISCVESSGVMSKKYKQFENDITPEFFINMRDSMPDYFENCVVWGGNFFAHGLPPSRHWIVWEKNTTNKEGQQVKKDQSDCELAYTTFKSPTVRRFQHVWNLFRAGNRVDEMQKRVHPNQKPVGLFVEIFEHYQFGQVILDFYGGSGSTLIACEKTSRHCRMMELDPAYVDVIVKRWEDFTGNTAVCEPSDAHFDQAELEVS